MWIDRDILNDRIEQGDLKEAFGYITDAFEVAIDKLENKVSTLEDQIRQLQHDQDPTSDWLR